MNTSSPTATFPFIPDSEVADFRARRPYVIPERHFYFLLFMVSSGYNVPDFLAQYVPSKTLTPPRLEFDISTAIHELLGHGSGLLLAETEPGMFNFDHANPPISPLEGKPISSWYKMGQTFSSVFGRISGCYSECHAECTALFLADEREIMRLFGCSEQPGDNGFDEILYASYLDMANLGLESLKAYDPTTKQWGQAHARVGSPSLMSHCTDHLRHASQSSVVFSQSPTTLSPSNTPSPTCQT